MIGRFLSLLATFSLCFAAPASAQMQFSQGATGNVNVATSAVATSSLTGTTTETTMLTITLPVMGPNDQLLIESLWSHLGAGGTWTPKVKLGATVVEGSVVNAAGTASANYYQLVANRGATNSQVFHVPGNIVNQGSSSAAPSTGTEETNAGAVLTFTGTLALGTDSMKLERWRVVVIRG